MSDELIVELIKSGFESLGKSIDVMRSDVTRMNKQTSNNSRAIAVCKQEMQNIKDEKKSDLQKIAVLVAIIGCVFAGVQIFFSLFPAIS